MTRRTQLAAGIKFLVIFFLAGGACAQQPATPQTGPGRAAPAPDAAGGRLLGNHPPLFFSEIWKQTEKEEHPIGQENVSNPNLTLTFFGSAKGGMQLTG